MISLTTYTTLFSFTSFETKSLITHTTLFYFTTFKVKSLPTLTALFKFSTLKMKSQTTLTNLCYFTTVTIKSLTTHTALFYFTTIHIVQFSFPKSLAALTIVFSSTILKWVLWRRRLPYFTSLLLKWNHSKANYSVLLRQYYHNEISGYTQYAVLLHYY